MCDVCADFLQLLESYETRITNHDAKHQILFKSEIETAYGYLQAWPQRQCMCLYRDIKNFERFNLVVQSMICLAVHHLKHIDRFIDDYKRLAASAAQAVSHAQSINSPANENISPSSVKSPELSPRKDQLMVKIDDIDINTNNDKQICEIKQSISPISAQSSAFTEEPWILPEVEKLLLLVAKAFLLNFPLYLAYKHGTHARLDDISTEEQQHLSIFCDLHDNEIPVYLLRNISLFCNSGGFAAMMMCFEHPELPVSTAHAITVTVTNIKLWLNYGCIVQLFVPLRSRVLQYMCRLSDQNLRSVVTRAIADFVWSSVRDPLDTSISFDVEGITLAFKYFTSSTLTMRLAGISQINAHISLFNEMCNADTVGEVEVVSQKIASWLTENHIIQHLFGPNLHVEVIKQAHVVLNFLAVENQITEEHIKLMWQATQLKHCSKTIFDILPQLVKNLAPRPALHLYSLLCRMDPKDHTEQSIYIASALTKFIWSRDNSRSQISMMQDHFLTTNTTASSSDSGSMDGTNSEDENGNGDDSSFASGRKSPIDIENVGSDTGATPCKQARRRRHICDPTEEKVKELSEEDLNLLNSKLKMQNHRIVNIIDNTSSEDDMQQSSMEIKMHRKKSRKRRKTMIAQPRSSHEFVDSMWDGGDDDVTSEEAEDGDGDGEIINDSDDCSDTGQVVPPEVLKHLQGEGPYIRAIAEAHISEILSGAENENSYSSPMSNKSEKNLADFDDEDVSPCEEEMTQLVNNHATRMTQNCTDAFAAAAVAMAAAIQKKTEANIAAANAANHALIASKRSDTELDINDINKEHGKISIIPTIQLQQPTFKINDVCQPGNTLLWDLLQDEKITQLGEALALETEKALATLLCFSMDRLLRTRFIEGCLQNLAENRSVIVSLRLLPKLFASFQQFRPTDSHQVTMWAENQHKMMFHFFNNIKFYAKRHAEYLSKGSNSALPTLLYSHKTEVSVRLNFLTSIFCTIGSPKTFRLSLEQVDALWEWLAHDTECADCYFAWLQSQAKGCDQHALGVEALQHLYLKKLPELQAENFSMVALGLFQQLCSLARLAMSQFDKNPDFNTSPNAVGMSHLWKIALRADNTEVSMAAIQYINMYYMGQQLKLEKEFVSECMEHLLQGAFTLETSADENALLRIQRGLMLLNTHLDTFRRRYAFHLRRWLIEGKEIGSRSNLKNDSHGPAIRIILQPAGLSEKSILHMHACDLIADLKAEISKWWESLQGASNSGQQAPVLGLLLSEGPLRIITQGQELTSDYDERSLGDAGFKDNQIVYVSLGGRGGRRKEVNPEHPSMQPPPPKECLPTMILLQPDYFEKFFCLMQSLSDMQILRQNFQLYSKAQMLSRRVWDILSILPLNSLLFDSFKNFTTLLSDAEKLISEEDIAKNKADMKQKLCELLDPNNLQKFMYALHIVETLTTQGIQQNRNGGCTTGCCNNINGNVEQMRVPKCSIVLKKAQTRRHISSDSPASNKEDNTKQSPNSSSTDIPKETSDSSTHKENIASNSTATNEADKNEQNNEAQTNNKESSPHKSIKRQRKTDSSHTTQSNKEKVQPIIHDNIIEHVNVNETTTDTIKWSAVFIKCGGIKHLYEIFISGHLQQNPEQSDLFNEWRHDCLCSLLRVILISGFEDIPTEDIMNVSIGRVYPFMVDLIEPDKCLRRLSTILNDEAYHNYVTNASLYQYSQFNNNDCNRGKVIKYAMRMMVSLVHASADAKCLLWSQPDNCNWVLKFILEEPDPSVRREICGALYRICLGNSQCHQSLLVPLLRKLISFLPFAEKMNSFILHHQFALTEEGKEPFGIASRDYFWLLARLVETLPQELVKLSLDTEHMGFGDDTIDIERLCQSVSKSIITREILETRHVMQDDALVGFLNLMTNLMKYDPKFKFSSKAIEFIEKIFEFLFDMPSPKNRQKPKCKSPLSRSSAYDLLVELCKNCPKNYEFLHAKLLVQHTPGTKLPYPWDYWPRDEGRSECGYVGLTNLGATCYMASCIQHLYMMPQARAAILDVPPAGAQKHATTLLELQRMFAYLLESERKAYNPRSFCRVYQMDHQPLNTGEQKDMAEFFIDLVSKLEEMTPDLKDLVKRLFCGTLSNNVVSLDCDHVSRTAEEFYTVRCQVADMRNLQESLDEVTVKDTLEGDNMYTCSQCGKKVRAEKRACFKRLPQILCFNTMRYTFNMVTMLKEKVNTHFSFPMLLNMSDYVEKTLMPHQYKEDREKLMKEKEENRDEMTDNKNYIDALNEEIENCLEYELVGVTVHTGTADGGHYYSFIKERSKPALDRWFLFNDAEVKPFDPSQIATECFGGEMTSKTYDSVTEKYLDFSFEKTNSAYMLFYERCLPDNLKQRQNELLEKVPLTVSPNKIIENLLKNERGFRFGDIKDDKIDITFRKLNVTDDRNQNVDMKSITDNELQASTSAAIINAAREAILQNDILHLNKELEEWIWHDNRQFLQDRNIFEHTYFNFMWQICSNIPGTLIDQADISCMSAKLSVSFFVETFIHAKEKFFKNTMVPWVELITKQFGYTDESCEWFLGHMSNEPWWPVQVLIQCPSQTVRQMFQRLVLHAIKNLRNTHAPLYLKTKSQENDKDGIGNASCITRFINSLILLMENGAKAHLRHLSDFFGLLFEFSCLGDEETVFLLRIGVIKNVVDFYLGNKTSDCIDVGSDNEDNSSDEALSVDKARPASLEKMIALVANLVERSRGTDFRLRLSARDYNAIAGGKGFPFLYQQIKDNINANQTKNLIYALCRWDERLANQIITMLFASVTKHTELCGPFFKLLTLLTDTQSNNGSDSSPGGNSNENSEEPPPNLTGLPCFSQLVLQRVWDAAEYCPQSALEWLAFQAPKNKIAHAWILQTAENWVEQFLLGHNNSRVRNAAAYLLVSLVPSQPFRANFRTYSLHKLSTLSSNIYRELSSDAQIILHTIINLLLRLLRSARIYADIGVHGTAKLTAYFSLLSYCMVSKTEKLLIGPYMRDLWTLFHPRLSEPSVPAHHNKHALLTFWHQSLVDCPENAQIVSNCPEITRNIAFNYIL